MEPAVWLDRLTDAVRELVHGVDVERVDDESSVFAHRDVVCTVHVYQRSTANIVVSRRGPSVSPETRVEHGEPHSETVDAISLLTLPRAIATALSR